MVTAPPLTTPSAPSSTTAPREPTQRGSRSVKMPDRIPQPRPVGAHRPAQGDTHERRLRPADASTATWHPDQKPPGELPITEVHGWLFVPDGRVVLVFLPHSDPALPCLVLPDGPVTDEDISPRGNPDPARRRHRQDRTRRVPSRLATTSIPAPMA